MELIVPWRLFVPVEFVGAVLGDDQQGLKTLASHSGIRIDTAEAKTVLGDGHEAGLVVTMHGTMWQKRTAGRRLVDVMFEARGMDESKWWTWSGSITSVLPGSARDAVATTQMQDSVAAIGSKISIGEVLNGPAPRFLVQFEGNAQQVVSAATRVNTVVQDLVDRFQLGAADFDEGQSEAPPSVAHQVNSARVAPMSGLATQAPHSHPAMVPTNAMMDAPAGSTALAHVSLSSMEAGPPTVLATSSEAGAYARAAKAAARDSVSGNTASDASTPVYHGRITAQSHPIVRSGGTEPSQCAPHAAALEVKFSGAPSASAAAHSAVLPAAPVKDRPVFTAASFDHDAGRGLVLLSRLPLLLPRRVVEGSLLPSGHLALIAQRCGVQIDVASDPLGDARVVTLTGSTVANAMATFQLQWRIAQCV